MSSNIELAKKVINELWQLGVREFCICAGARNSPFVVLLASQENSDPTDFNPEKFLQNSENSNHKNSDGYSESKVYHFFEERSAAFFALGRIQSSGRPVAVITTSGTAVAELLPAVIESYYSGWPLVLVTADRPRNYRGSGAPQSIEQVGIFGTYVDTCLDIESVDESINLNLWTKRRSLHLNICFEEPLLDGKSALDKELTSWFNDFKNQLSQTEVNQNFPEFEKLRPAQIKKMIDPIMLVGTLPLGEVKNVVDYILKYKLPVYAESLSNLRGHPEIQPYLIQGGEKSVTALVQQNICKSILRVGGVPTLRLWRDLEYGFKTVPVYSINQVEFSGLSRPSFCWSDFSNLKYLVSENKAEDLEKIKLIDQKYSLQLQDLIWGLQDSEVAMIQLLAEKIQNQNIFIGNSLPIREWDLTAKMNWNFHQVMGHRGANGIDGQVSGFLGASSSSYDNWCVLGDLTTMYDMVAPWIISQLEPMNLNLVIVNNSGGQIFTSMFGHKGFVNSHQLQFKSLAEMWSAEYVLCKSTKELQNFFESNNLNSNRKKFRIIELQPNTEQSNVFWKAYKNI